MARDERLLPLPTATTELQTLPPQDIPSTYSPVYDGDPFAEARSVREYISVVLKRKWMILAIVTVITVCTAIYMHRLPSTYTAAAEVLVETRAPKKTGDQVYINFWVDAKYWDTQVRLISSPELMRDAVVTLGLHRNPNLIAEQPKAPSIFGAITNMITGGKPPTVKTPTLPVLTGDLDIIDVGNVQLTPEEAKRAEEYGNYLLGGLSVEPIEKTNLITLKYEHVNQELASTIPNAVAVAFIARDAKREMQGAIQQTEDNARQIVDLQANINRLENERIGYMQSKDLPLQQAQGEALSSSRLQTYSTNWLAAEKNRRDLQAEYEAAMRAKQSGQILSVVSDVSPIRKAQEQNRTRVAELEKRLEAIDAKIEELNSKKAQLLVKYTEEYPEVIQISEQIKTWKETKDKMQREVATKIEEDSKKLTREAEKDVLTGLQSKYQAAIKQENDSKAAYFRERAAANVQGQDEIRLLTLTQEIETNRKLLDNALQRQKELELAKNDSRPNNIKVTRRAESAGPVGPNRQRNITIAFLASLIFGIGLAFVLDYLDDSIKSSDDVGRHLGLPTLALIPHYGSLERSVARGKLTAGAAVSGSGASTAMVALDDSRSALAEAYRHLRTSLLFSSAGKPPQTILVTSSQPSEGKTTTAINTAITLAQAGADVVLIDCDLRRPRLHHHFQLENTHGLTNFLSGERNTSELIKECDKLPNLKIVTSGPIPPNPAELLSSIEMRNLIDFLRSNFKHVIIDSPPAISFTDAVILSTLVDGVIIVAMVGKSSIHMIKRFRQRLTGVGSRIYGVVLNGLKRHSVDYGYYGYGYSYYYTYNDDETASNGNGSTNGNGTKKSE
ncbi:MAG TPA: polysaccharide biosynthesis tyrosine autokinase [Pyrinomonadaceae bacterium]|nr:polysaccharide biosynthesis tyrosine autokinase [Pyrinomonadaceae bacterium]